MGLLTGDRQVTEKLVFSCQLDMWSLRMRAVVDSRRSRLAVCPDGSLLASQVEYSLRPRRLFFTDGLHRFSTIVAGQTPDCTAARVPVECPLLCVGGECFSTLV